MRDRFRDYKQAPVAICNDFFAELVQGTAHVTKKTRGEPSGALNRWWIGSPFSLQR